MKNLFLHLVVALLAPISALTASEPTLIRWSFPEYPALTRIAGYSGIVKVRAHIRNDGSVESVNSYKATPDGNWERFAGTAEKAMKAFIFDQASGAGDRFYVFIFIFQTLPEEIPAHYTTSEKIEPNIFVIRTKFVPPEYAVSH